MKPASVIILPINHPGSRPEQQPEINNSYSCYVRLDLALFPVENKETGEGTVL